MVERWTCCLQVLCLPPSPPHNVDVKWINMTGHSIPTTMKRAVKMGGSNIDWGERGELQNRFNTPLYYIFASFWSRSTYLWAKIVGFKREIFTLYMHVGSHFEHLKNLTQLILFWRQDFGDKNFIYRACVPLSLRYRHRKKIYFSKNKSSLILHTEYLFLLDSD